MRNTLIFGVLIVTAVVAGLFLRLPSLHYRPLHTDEAVHADKLGDLLERNDYKYDKFEFHGPTLNYFTLIPAAIAGQKTFIDLDEFTLRIVPVFFGMALILVPLLMTAGLGRMSVFIAAALTAVSPAMVYYSRYYIQEMLLVCFSLSVIGCIFRYLQSRKVRWLLLAGISYGLMGATKETFVIACSCGLFAAAAVWYFSSEKASRLSKLRSYIGIKPIAVFAVSAAVIWVVFFSSFFTNRQGIADSFLTFTTYLNRAHGEGRHHHPWHYYLHILLFWKHNSGPLFTEAIIVLLSLAGGAFAFCKRNFVGEYKPLVRFFALYTLLMTAAYAMIPYKTPWCLLGFFSGMIVLAGFAGACLLSLAKGTGVKIAVCSLLIAGLLHLAAMSYLSGTKYAAEPANPYVYSHTSMDIYEISDKIIKTVNASDTSGKTVVQIIADGGSYWPFPWYLRSLDNIGYWDSVDARMSPPSLVILSAVYGKRIGEIEEQLISHLYNSLPSGQKELYMPLFDGYMELRPRVEVRGYMTQKLWEQANKQPNIK
ncbi:MAG: TIGR03663 family protein [Planctomycetes bacterium]|nr:TIGR03663 family protein [Planctomycetota bacterium]